MDRVDAVQPKIEGKSRMLWISARSRIDMGQQGSKGKMIKRGCERVWLWGGVCWWASAATQLTASCYVIYISRHVTRRAASRLPHLANATVAFPSSHRTVRRSKWMCHVGVANWIYQLIENMRQQGGCEEYTFWCHN